jgi:hypothetical protein
VPQQFGVPCDFLLVLDDDCPHEEVTTFCLLGANRALSQRWLGVPPPGRSSSADSGPRSASYGPDEPEGAAAQVHSSRVC